MELLGLAFLCVHVCMHVFMWVHAYPYVICARAYMCAQLWSGHHAYMCECTGVRSTSMSVALMHVACAHMRTHACMSVCMDVLGLERTVLMIALHHPVGGHCVHSFM